MLCKYIFYLLVAITVLNVTTIFGQHLYLKGQMGILTFNSYTYQNTVFFSDKNNRSIPILGSPQLLLGFQYSDKNAFELGVLYKVNTMSFEVNQNGLGNNVLTINLPNSWGIPIKYRRTLVSEYKKKYDFTASIGGVVLFQNEVNTPKSLWKISTPPYTVNGVPTNIKGVTFIVDAGIGITKKISDNLSLCIDYNYWLGTSDYAQLSLKLENQNNVKLDQGNIVFNGTSHNFSLGLKYEFDN